MNRRTSGPHLEIFGGAAEPAVGHGLEHVELDRLTRDHNPVREPLF